MLYRDVGVIIPVYNEGKVVAKTIKKVMEQFPFVVCVNDGSRDNSAAQIAKTGAHLVDHPLNMGQGAALQTGLDYALQFKRLKYFVTFDADGQHGINDVVDMVAYIKAHKEVDVMLGSRFRGKAENISFLKKQLLRLAVIVTNWTTGLKLSDAHNGLRVFNRNVAEKLNITMPDMAHASEIIHRIAEHGFNYHELPITIAYTDYSKAKGQPMLNAVNIMFDLMLQRMAKK